jgi:hypothetical protein
VKYESRAKYTLAKLSAVKRVKKRVKETTAREKYLWVEVD